MRFASRRTGTATLLAAMLTGGMATAASGQVTLQAIGGYGAGLFDSSAAEISAYDPGSQRLFVTNSGQGTLDVLDLSDPTLPTLVQQLTLGADPNSVATYNGLVAVAVAPTGAPANPGGVFILDAQTLNNVTSTITVGALPDMLTFTPDGSKLLVANEGEPDGVDPLGSVSIIDTNTFTVVGTADFSAFTDLNVATTSTPGAPGNTPTNAIRRDPGVTTLAEDVEPEYIAVSPDGTTAYVTLQEANSVGVLDLSTNTFTAIQALGTKDHGAPGNELDASDRDSGVNITSEPVFGMFMPDAIASYSAGGTTYYVTANEGDARSEDERIGDLVNTVNPLGPALDPTAFPNASTLTDNEELGRLGVSTWDGDTDGDGDYDALFSYGSRSFSIFDENGNLVFDSGDDFETITANTAGVIFNANNDENDSFESRSDNKGPEPEGVTLGEIDGRTYAFIGLERVGGVMIYDITDPTNASFESYLNLRDFTIPDEDDADPDNIVTLAEAVNASTGTITSDLGSLDLGPEGLLFISAADSPNGQALLVVTNEVSGTTTVYSIIPEPGAGLALLASAGLTFLRRRRR
jgi:YVTN family beta-propeller protein